MEHEKSRRDEDRGRLEALVEAAKQEAGARREELARRRAEFEAEMASAEAGLADRVSFSQGIFIL